MNLISFLWAFPTPLPLFSCPAHLLGDAAVLVEVIQVERPIQPVVYRSPKDHGQPSHKVLGRRQGGKYVFRYLSLNLLPQFGPQILAPEPQASLAHLLQLTSKLTEPSWLVSKALKRKVAYVLESAEQWASELGSQTAEDFRPPWGSPNTSSLGIPGRPPQPSPQLSLEMDGQLLPSRPWPLTSLREELRVDLLEVLLIDNSTGTFLGSGEMGLRTQTKPPSTSLPLPCPETPTEGQNLHVSRGLTVEL